MGDLQLALIAAGSALAGSGLTGWFTILAGRRQAGAAQYAGDKQAEAVLRTVQQTLDEQRLARLQDARRAAYAAFLTAAEQKAEELSPGGRIVSTARRSDATIDLYVALNLVELEGPPSVLEQAVRVRSLLNRPASDRSMNHEMYRRARAQFITASQEALKNG
ncbi:hypothetical protein ACH4S9_39335 [Streptomyces sp. NPDC021225]|uniref:hypothetical protein n=1 Tax=Streptomyces sp. NPDC021225 TaxID=3365121 RepID=UPI0037B05A75